MKKKILQLVQEQKFTIILLIGTKINLNNLPARSKILFVYYHKMNDEIYFISAGSGKAVIDGKSVELTTGD